MEIVLTKKKVVTEEVLYDKKQNKEDLYHCYSSQNREEEIRKEQMKMKEF
ncbi:MAG: hypothetical protein K8T10_20030 [Candidatus Eremiobacteraeota bacterium]|nr:hypothetical protein [Candidatus Eremiobacteraeota bacterium]